MRAAQVTEKRSLTNQHKNPAPHEDLIKNVDQVVLQTQPVCKPSQTQMDFLQLCTPLLNKVCCSVQSGSKTCHSTKKFPRINFPKYVISISTRKFLGIDCLFQLGDVNWTIFGDLPLGFVVGCPSIFWW